MTDQPQPENIIELAKKLRKQLDAADANTINRMIEAYRTVYKRLSAEIDAFVQRIAQEANPLTEAQIIRLSQYKTLMLAIQEELKRYGGFLETEISVAAQAALKMGVNDGVAMIRAQMIASGLPEDVITQIKALNPAALETIVGFLDKNGALYQRLAQSPIYTAEQVAKKIIEGVGLGRNPATIAGEINRALGMGLTDALRMMRTVQIYSYREANRASYIANSDVVEGWVWYAELDSETCSSCIAMHGTVHNLDETLNDHHNGRCAMLPLTIGSKNPVEVSGEDWFKDLSESEQKSIMGEGKWEAWNDGKFDFSALSQEHADDVYGNMRSETPLKDLINA